MVDFDKVLHEGFEGLLGITIEEKWWRLAQLPPKYGGMALRSGLRTLGAQHLCSLVKSADDVERIVGGWDVVAIAQRETEDLFNIACEYVSMCEFKSDRGFEAKGLDKNPHYWLDSTVW